MIAAVTVVIVRQGGGSGQHQGGQRHQRRKQHHLLHLLFLLFRGFVPNSASTDPASPAGASSRNCEPSLGVLPPACPSRYSGGEAHRASARFFVPRRARAGRTRVACGGTQRVKEYYPTGGINRAVPGAQAGPKWA